VHPLQIPLWIWAATVAALAGHPAASGQFFAGWLTEYSLSVDNLFVFVLLISRSAVPRELRSRVLLLGVALALLLRGIFIAPGASPLHRFGWLLYLFGAFLLYTAARLAVSGRRSSEEEVPRMIQRFMPRAASAGAGAATALRESGTSQFGPHRRGQS